MKFEEIAYIVEKKNRIVFWKIKLIRLDILFIKIGQYIIL